MSWLLEYARSTVGRKQVLALSGVVWLGFLVAHLAGNFLLLLGPAHFNLYGHGLTSNPLLPAAETFLVVALLTHIGLAISITLSNRAARGPERYRLIRSRGRPSRRSFASQTMLYTGALIAAFLVLHLATFKFGSATYVTYASVLTGPASAGQPVPVRDLYALVVKRFEDPGYCAIYVAAMLILGTHLHHAIASALETFGLDHPRWTPIMGGAAKALAWAIALGFLLFPIIGLLGRFPHGQV